MQFSEQWLRTWCNPNITTEQLSNALTMSGLEVEELQAVAKEFNSIVIAEVLEVEPHPNADKLRICKVNTGSETLQIVCGAKNVEAGLKVPCALIGAKIPLDDGSTLNIKLGKLRGVESFGMLCSANELGLESNVDGLLILPADAPIGQDIREYLNLNDNIFTIKLTPNRADCLSIQGVARELSAITGSKIENITINYDKKPSFDSKHKVTIDDNAHNLCPRFLAREVTNIQIKGRTAPEYILQRLQRSGLRSVNAIVDISNYVMLELGQPSHMFDADILGNDIKVHWSDLTLNNTSNTNDNKLTLLNDSICEIQKNTGIISDENGMQSLAGVMGGKSTSITDETTNILIECAFWFPATIAGKTKQYKLNSDAAYRYERGVDPNLAPIAIERITQLVLEICSTEQTQISSVQDINLNVSTISTISNPKQISVSNQDIQKLIGQHISIEKILEILSNLNLSPSFDKEKEIFSVNVPSYRFDLNIPEDITEEIIRLYGFDNITLRPPKASLEFLPYATNKHNIKDFRYGLAKHGYNEVISFGFTSPLLEEQFSPNPSQLKLKNPIAEQYQVMRSTLLGGLVEKLVYNQQQHKPNSIRLFESGVIFNIDNNVQSSLSSVNNISEYVYISGIANGLNNPHQWGINKQSIDFYDVKGDIESILHGLGVDKLEFKASQHIAFHQGRCASIWANDIEIGVIGELHPQLQQHYNINSNTIGFEINFSKIQHKAKLNLKEINKNPAVKRDIAIVVNDDVSAQTLIDSLANLGKQNKLPAQVEIFNIDVFDVFKPKQEKNEQANNVSNNSISTNEKSIALQFFLQKQGGTLTDEELTSIMNSAIENLQQYGKLRT
ncbi:MAG: hypothetical protein RLZZ210_1774 [Pseudomonadota bacterium]|jgi:phenylalanyl-tRNA synthetase beta chain